MSVLHILANGLSPVCTDGCGLPNPSNTSGVGSGSPLDTALQVLFGILGAMAMLVIVIAGLRYITSAGDPQKASNARSTIIFALIGLVVAITAEAIVTFVVKGVA